MRTLLLLLRNSPERPRLLLLGLVGVLALGLGFVAFTPSQVKPWIVFGAYYYILGLFTLLVYYLGKIFRGRWSAISARLRHPGWVGIALLAATGFTLSADPFGHKILFDEYVLQATAQHMHSTKEFGAVVRAYDIAGTWVTIDAFVDKRPYFFVFLVSLLHDLTGFRLANIFLVNVALTPLFFVLLYWFAQELTGRGPALLAAALLATLPLLAQNSTGAGMELHNVTMILVECALATLYLREPDADRLSALVLGAVLLAESRYESVIFVVPVAVLVLVGWKNAGRILLPWPVMISPLLLVPYAWHNRVLSATPVMWQLKAGQTSRFSLGYLRENLKGAWVFFFNVTPTLANSFYLTLLGAIALLWALWYGWRWVRSTERVPFTPAVAVLLAFGLTIAGNLTLLMFYYWSRLDEVIASRFALPMCVVFALLAAVFLGGLGKWRGAALRIASFGLLGWLFVGTLPAIAKRPYTEENLVMREVAWEHDVLVQHSGPILFLTNKSTIPFVLWRIPTILTSVGATRGAQIAYHMHEGTFKEVIVAQAMRPTSIEGDRGVDPEDELPASFHLETIVEKRFGGRWARLSRVIAIDPGKDLPEATPKLAVTNPAGPSAVP
jgi:Dolichyl-phosphate-mannose-protein mannosyltransferase